MADLDLIQALMQRKRLAPTDLHAQLRDPVDDPLSVIHAGGYGQRTPSSLAGRTPESEGAWSNPQRPVDRFQDRVAEGIAQMPAAVLEASGVAEALRSGKHAYDDPTRENIGNAALNTMMSVPGISAVGRAAEAAAGPLARATSRVGDMLPETTAGKAAFGGAALGGATLAGTADAGPVDDFRAEYLKNNPFPKEMSREEFIKSRREAAAAPYLTGKRPDKDEATRVGGNAAKRAAQEYEAEMASIGKRKAQWQTDFDSAWQQKLTQEKKMGERPFLERNPGYSDWALPVALGVSATLPAGVQALTRAAETAPLRRASKALDTAVGDADASFSAANTASGGTAKAALDREALAKALAGYETAAVPKERSWMSGAGDFASVGVGAAAPSFATQFPYLMDYQQPEGSRARDEAAGQFTLEKMKERMLGPGLAGVGVAGVSRAVGAPAAKRLIDPAPSGANLARAQAMGELPDASKVGTAIRDGIQQDSLTDTARGVASDVRRSAAEQERLAAQQRRLADEALQHEQAALGAKDQQALTIEGEAVPPGEASQGGKALTDQTQAQRQLPPPEPPGNSSSQAPISMGSNNAATGGINQGPLQIEGIDDLTQALRDFGNRAAGATGTKPPPAGGIKGREGQLDPYNLPNNGVSPADAARQVYLDASGAGAPTTGKGGTLTKAAFPKEADAALQSMSGDPAAKGLSAEQLHKRRLMAEKLIGDIAKRDGTSYRDAATKYFAAEPTVGADGMRRNLPALSVGGAVAGGAMLDPEAVDPSTIDPSDRRFALARALLQARH